MRPQSAVLLCSDSVLGHGVLKALHSAAVKPQLIYDQRRAASLKYSRLAAKLLASDDFDKDADRIVSHINAAHRRGSADIVLASDLAGLQVLAKNRAALEAPLFPMPAYDVLMQLADKWSFYELCLRLNLGTPRTVMFSSVSAVDLKTVQELGYPVVVKPRLMAGGEGVRVVATEDDLRRSVLADPAYTYAGIIVQEYIPGSDIGLGLFARNGKVEHAATFNCGENWSTLVTPRHELVSLGERVIADTTYSGVANFDARVEAGTGRIRLLECNPRFFHRITATRMCGLNFLLPGLNSATQPTLLTEGTYYSPNELATARGWGRIVSGEWPVGAALQSLRDLLIDPLPNIARKVRQDPVS